MEKYTSNTYFLIDRIFYLILYIVLIGLLTYFFANINVIKYGGLTSIPVLIFVLLWSISKLATLEYNEKNINITYRFPFNQKSIDYSSIIEIQHISGYKSTTLNIIKYKQKDSLKNKKLKIRNVVQNDKFIEFIKWMKTKNEQIEFTFLPTDSKLKEAYLKEFS